MVKEKSVISADKIFNDPAFERTRENMAEFGRAANASKVLRTAFRFIQQDIADSRMVGRLTGLMMDVIHLDAINTRGLRNVIDGEAALLEGFDFNLQSKFSTVFFASYTANINRVTGDTSVSILSYIPANMIAAPSGTTHFQLFMAAASVDFENKIYDTGNNYTGFLAWDNAPTTGENLSVALLPASTHPLFIAFGIEFYQEVNGTKYPLKNGAYNAASLVEVDTI